MLIITLQLADDYHRDCHRSLNTLILAKDADGEYCQMPLQSQETANGNFYGNLMPLPNHEPLVPKGGKPNNFYRTHTDKS